MAEPDMVLRSALSTECSFPVHTKFTQLLVLNTPRNYKGSALVHCACAHSTPSSACCSASHVFPDANAERSAKARSRYTWTSRRIRTGSCRHEIRLGELLFPEAARSGRLCSMTYFRKSRRRIACGEEVGGSEPLVAGPVSGRVRGRGG